MGKKLPSSSIGILLKRTKVASAIAVKARAAEKKRKKEFERQ